MSAHRMVTMLFVSFLASALPAGVAGAASPCDSATHPTQCGWFDSATLPPFVKDAIATKGGTLGAGNVLVLSSGDPADPDSEISNDVNQAGCGTNPDGWQTYDCVLMDTYVPPVDSVVLALSSEWFEWYQTIFTDWMTIAGAGVPTVDVSINSWIQSKVSIIPYGPMETGVVLLTSLSAQKMVNFRVADSGDHIYDTNILVVPATWFSTLGSTNTDSTLLCGNGTLEPGEECDDGNSITGDGCSSLCLGAQILPPPGPPGSPPPAPPSPATCGNLVYVWPTVPPTTASYTCGADLCAGFRCVVGNTISPACYAADQCAPACAGACVDVQTAQLDCTTMCTVQPPPPPAGSPPPVLPLTCTTLAYSWPDGTTMPYSCDDSCVGQRCVTGTTISPACYQGLECAAACPGPDGICVDTPAADCGALCAMGEKNPTCTLLEKDTTRNASNQQGACLGNIEACSGAGFWEIADGSYAPVPEVCNGIDDDCNGVVDDRFVTCGDPGLCQNTINTCDPANPSVPLICTTLPPPSPVEICNDGLDNDCDGAADDGCQCGDNECMPGETFLDCPADCPAPANGTPCEDGNLCTAGDAWQNKVCTPGTPVVCDGGGNACVTGGSCDPATGCSATKLDCTDNDPCTIDTCDPGSGCASAPDPACQVQDADGDGYPSGSDCNDNNAAIHPGAVELCNGIDDNCNGQVDEGFNVGTACQSAANDCGVSGNGFLVCAASGVTTVCDAVTPANPAGYGDACTSAANACGGTAAGTKQCDGSCSAVTPTDPAGYGDACTSAANACGGTAAGTKQCGGTCSAVTPADPAGYGVACTSAPNACGVTGAGTTQCDGTCNAVTPAAVDTDGDGTPDCLDQCPNDANKTAAGSCGCGAPETCTSADLSLKLQGVPEKVRVGREIEYRFKVKNHGPDAATSVMAEFMCSGVAYHLMATSSGCVVTGGSVKCSLGTLRSDRPVTGEIMIVADAVGALSCTASVSSATPDPVLTNQSDTEHTRVR